MMLVVNGLVVAHVASDWPASVVVLVVIGVGHRVGPAGGTNRPDVTSVGRHPKISSR